MMENDIQEEPTRGHRRRHYEAKINKQQVTHYQQERQDFNSISMSCDRLCPSVSQIQARNLSAEERRINKRNLTCGHRLGQQTRENCSSKMIKKHVNLAMLMSLVMLMLLLPAQTLIKSTNAQYLFTYEINSESDDSRTPKSSLFDPSSFKIVTPAQLQSTYNRLAGAGLPQAPPPSEASLNLVSGGDQSGGSINQQPAADPLAAPATQQASPTSALAPNQPQESPRESASSSFLKQTSAALQSFVELFHLAPSSSPSPLGEAPSAALTERAASNSLVDQQAEARSLHEHWTQEQQRAHQQSNSPHHHQSALQSFSATASPPSSTTTLASNSLASNHQQHLQKQQTPNSAASYWLTANPLTPPDGNFLVEVKQPETQRQSSHEVSTGNNLVENVASVSQQQTLDQHHRHQLNSNQQAQFHHHHHHQQEQQPQSTSSTHGPSASQRQLPAPTQGSAQSSFMSTPSNFLPNLAPVSPSPPATQPSLVPQLASSTAGRQQQLASTQSQPLHAHQPRSLQNKQQHFASTLSADDGFNQHQLQPPANTPDNFNLASQAPSAPLKSAEESLLAFRQEQQQSALAAAQQQHQEHLQAQREHQHETDAATRGESLGGPVALGASNERDHLQQQRPQQQEAGRSHFAPHQLNQPQARQQPQTSNKNSLGDIPKVSPQIYESFLLQQKDQFEKHMELLKQQQELNKLLEQKQKQQQEQTKQQELQRKRKKEELERTEARKKSAAAQRQAQEQQRLKLHSEEEARRRQEQQQQEAERRRKLLAEQQEAAARKYREELLAEQREKEEKARRAREQEERERLEKERELALERERREQQEAKLKSYLRQQEELRKLLELKQREDEATARRRQQAVATTGQQQTQSTRSVGNIPARLQASRLALEHRERSSSSRATSASSPSSVSSWGAPLRASRSRTTTSLTTTTTSSSPSEPTTLMGGSTQTAAPSIVQTPSTTTTTASSTSTASSSARTRLHKNELKRQKVADEKLIRQKIPLYSGAGKYGLYRSSSANDSTLAELAALLDSVILPSSTTTSTTPSPAPLDSSSSSGTTELSVDYATSPSSASTISFDDDVPRRPVRTLVQQGQQPSSASSPTPVVVTRAARTLLANSSSSTSGGGRASQTAHIGLASLPADSDNDGIPGRAGIEYPVLSEVPRTSFNCANQPLNGYYADTETACQVVHLCQQGVQSSILCPNGTIFNQEKFSCQWWYEVNCSRAPNFYQLNDNLYKTLPGGSSTAAKATSSAAEAALAANVDKLKRTRVVPSSANNL